MAQFVRVSGAYYIRDDDGGGEIMTLINQNENLAMKHKLAPAIEPPKLSSFGVGVGVG